MRRFLVFAVLVTTLGIAAVPAVGNWPEKLNGAADADSQATPCRVPPESARYPGDPPAALIPIFERASKEFGIPADVLIAVSLIESHWSHRPVPSVHNTYGAMGLQREFGDDIAPLKMASELVGLPEDSLKTSVDANIRGAAALLAYEFVELHGDSDRARKMSVLENWRGVLRRYTRYDSDIIDDYFERFCDYLRSRGFGTSVETKSDSNQAN